MHGSPNDGDALSVEESTQTHTHTRTDEVDALANVTLQQEAGQRPSHLCYVAA